MYLKIFQIPACVGTEFFIVFVPKWVDPRKAFPAPKQFREKIHFTTRMILIQICCFVFVPFIASASQQLFNGNPQGPVPPIPGGSMLEDPFGDCSFACPDGSSGVPNPTYRPKQDGCGLPGLHIQNLDFEMNKDTNFVNCCNEHDVCYGTCGMKKDDCDTDFRKCMLQWCSKRHKKTEKLEACEKRGNIFATTTKIGGCRNYREAQKGACLCTKEDEL